MAKNVNNYGQKMNKEIEINGLHIVELKRNARVKKGEPKPVFARAPWNGGLSKADIGRPGGALIAALLYQANKNGHQQQELADALNVTHGYMCQLRGGHRLTANISDDFVNAASLYLSVPRMTIYMLSGRVTPDDVLLHKNNIKSEIENAIEFIAKDAVHGPLMPPSVRDCDLGVQRFIVSMYEKATNKVLLDGKKNHEEFAWELAEILRQRELLVAKVELVRLAKLLASEVAARKAASSAGSSGEKNVVDFKVAGSAKFKDDVGNSWSGHGRKPSWFIKALESGKTATELAA